MSAAADGPAARRACPVGTTVHNGCVTGLAWAWLDTPVGRLSVGCSGSGVARVHFDRLAGREVAGSGSQLRDDRAGADCAQDARRQLAEYCCGRRHAFDLPLDWSAVCGQRRRVLGVLFDRVRYGQTVTYGALARQAGLPQDGPELPARAVGRIMGSNPIPVIVPCHRVVAGDGLGGYSGGTGLEVKRWLLILEGALPPTLDWEPARLDA
jgi:methylated-DNA-[protein]-cysteine S-methyltransferase